MADLNRTSPLSSSMSTVNTFTPNEDRCSSVGRSSLFDELPTLFALFSQKNSPDEEEEDQEENLFNEFSASGLNGNKDSVLTLPTTTVCLDEEQCEAIERINDQEDADEAVSPTLKIRKVGKSPQVGRLRGQTFPPSKEFQSVNPIEESAESRIFTWLDSQQIIQVDPTSKREQYYDARRDAVLQYTTAARLTSKSEDIISNYSSVAATMVIPSFLAYNDNRINCISLPPGSSALRLCKISSSPLFNRRQQQNNTNACYNNCSNSTGVQGLALQSTGIVVKKHFLPSKCKFEQIFPNTPKDNTIDSSNNSSPASGGITSNSNGYNEHTIEELPDSPMEGFSSHVSRLVKVKRSVFKTGFEKGDKESQSSINVIEQQQPQHKSSTPLTCALNKRQLLLDNEESGEETLELQA